MNKTFLLSSIFIAVLLGCPNKVFSQLFYDSFESQDMSTTNSDGFSWGANNKTSVVTQHPTDGPVAVYNNGSIYNIHSPVMPDGTVRDWTAFDGDYSLRFRYASGTGSEWTEQRFNTGTAYPELWVQYWIRIPTNFKFGGDSWAMNHKFLSVWMDGYEGNGEGSTVWLGMHPISSDPTRASATLAYTYSQGNNTGSGGYQQATPFITAADRGNWIQITLQVKAETSDGADDGIIRSYVRKQGESTHTLFHEDLEAPLRIPPNGPAGFQRGYILGWTSTAYDEETEWLLDGFTVSNTSLLDSSLSINDEVFNNTISITPNPTANTFTIDLGNEILKKVIIYNELGQQIKEIPIVSETNQVDVSNLSNGIYFVKVTFQSGKTATKKIIKN